MSCDEQPVSATPHQLGAVAGRTLASGRNVKGLHRYWVFAPVALAVVLPVVLFFYAELGQARLRDATAELTASESRQATVEEFLRSLLDAEAAQRGFLLTEDKSYLAPYDPSVRRVPQLLDSLEASYRQAGSQQALSAIRELRLKAGMKIGELNSSLRLYGEFGRPAAVALVYTDLGKKTLEDIRRSADGLLVLEGKMRAAETRIWVHGIRVTRILIGLATLLGMAFLIASGTLLGRNVRRREAEAFALDARNRELDLVVKERTRNLSALSSHLQNVSEAEKSALARELHDELGGLLVATKMDLMWLRRRLDNSDPQLAERWNRVLKSLDEGVELKRRIIENLRPTLLDNLGLIAALRWLVAETGRRSGLSCHEKYAEGDLTDLSAEANITIYRVVQECLTNVMKHARATRVDVELQSHEQYVRVTVQDNGQGIALHPIGLSQSFGIAGMQHRVSALGGTTSVDLAPSGRGTIVNVTIPRDRVPGQGVVGSAGVELQS
jgi:signal transduction histidine kinase